MKAFLLILSIACSLEGLAQQDYFVFMQSEKRQPFYVRLGEKTYSSSSTGHVILSKLKDSAYVFTVGFPQNQFPEQDFAVRVHRKDRGLELKNLGDKGWALFDWHTMELISPAKTASAGSGGGGYSLVKKNDDFAKLMSSVVNDTAVMYAIVMEEKKEPVLVAKEPAANDVAKVETPVQQPEVKKPEPVAEKLDTVRAIVTKDVPKDNSTTAQKDTAVAKDAVVKQTPEVAPEPKQQDTVKAQPEVAKNIETKKEPETIVPKKIEEPIKDSVLNPPALPVIVVVKQFKSDTGYHMLITDEQKDSIDIFIAADAPEVKKEETAVVETEKKTTPEVKPEVKQPGVTQPKQDSVVNKPPSEPVTQPAADTVVKQTKLFMINSDCRAFATNNDVDKLRVKLINEKDSEDRIAAAKKVFKSRCFSALQIKALTELFPLDEQKYKFLEMAYPFVSDTGNFKGLVSLLQDPVYAQRFRKLVRLD